MNFPFHSAVVSLGFLLALPCQADVFHVDPKGNDKSGDGSNDRPWRNIQHALDQCAPGDSVMVHKGTYFETVEFNSSGTKAEGPISLIGEEGSIISGKGAKETNLISAENQSYLRILNLQLGNSHHPKESTAIMIEGGGSNITIRNCHISNCRGKNAIGIAFYGTNPTTPLSAIEVDGNSISDCEPAPSEALVLNGNVIDFKVTNNHIRNVNNIGIDFIGGEKDVVNDPTKVARQGVCRGNRVENARSNYGEGYAAGIYVDGGRDILIESNIVTQCDLGIEVGAENPGALATEIIVKGNTLYLNDKAGIVFGGYEAKRGRVQKCQFIENICYQNTNHAKPQGELWIQHASENVVQRNYFWVTHKKLMAEISSGGRKNVVDENTWYGMSPMDTIPFQVSETPGAGFAAWQATTGWDLKGKFAKWKFEEPQKPE